MEEADVAPSRPQPIRFDRARFPCTDSVRGVWRVDKEMVWGDVKHPVDTHWGIASDSIRMYQADTLIFAQSYAITNTGPAERLSPNSHIARATFRITFRPNEPDGYYARFLSRDTLFLHHSYNDWYDFWLVRDCR